MAHCASVFVALYDLLQWLAGALPLHPSVPSLLKLLPVQLLDSLLLWYFLILPWPDHFSNLSFDCLEWLYLPSRDLYSWYHVMLLALNITRLMYLLFFYCLLIMTVHQVWISEQCNMKQWLIYILSLPKEKHIHMILCAFIGYLIYTILHVLGIISCKSPYSCVLNMFTISVNWTAPQLIVSTNSVPLYHWMHLLVLVIFLLIKQWHHLSLQCMIMHKINIHNIADIIITMAIRFSRFISNKPHIVLPGPQWDPLAF